MSEQMQGEVAELSSEIEQLDDLREGYARVRAKILGYRQAGMRVPEELTLLERNLVAECMAASQGRD